jgi:DNA-binding MarR family transcriptional regulator
MKQSGENTEIHFNNAGFGYLLNKVRQSFFSVLEQQLAPLDITPAQFLILVSLAHKRGNSPSEFARLMNYDAGAMTRLLDRVEKKDLIQRERSTEDRRIVQIVLTDKARELYPRILEIVARVQDHMLSGLNTADKTVLENLLKRISLNAGRPI